MSAEVVLWQTELLTGMSGLVHGVSLRTGGVSSPPFATLNTGLHVGDDARCVRENRRRVAAALGTGLATWVCARQVHGTRIHVATRADAGRGAFAYERAVPATDALVTATPGVTLTVFVADCAPVFLVDPEQRVLGLAHTGWRSLAGGIVGRTVDAMKSAFGVDPTQLHVAVGPCLGPCCFEIGPEVASQFAHEFLSAGEQGRPHLNLGGAIVAELENHGVSPRHISASPECTKCHADKYFSYRAARGGTGRMVAAIAMVAARRDGSPERT